MNRKNNVQQYQIVDKNFETDRYKIANELKVKLCGYQWNNIDMKSKQKVQGIMHISSCVTFIALLFQLNRLQRRKLFIQQNHFNILDTHSSWERIQCKQSIKNI